MLVYGDAWKSVPDHAVATTDAWYVLGLMVVD